MAVVFLIIFFKFQSIKLFDFTSFYSTLSFIFLQERLRFGIMLHILFDIEGVLRNAHENGHIIGVNHTLSGIIKLLKSTGKAKIYIATDMAFNSAEKFLKDSDFYPLFTELFCPANTGFMKYEKNFYDEVNFKLGYPEIPPIFFDDSQSNVMTATQAGWYAYLYQSTDTLKRNDFIKQLLEKEQNR